MVAAAPDPARRYTADEFARLPDHKHYELVDGRVVERTNGVAAALVGGDVLGILGRATDDGTAMAFAGGLGYHCYPGRPDTVRRPSATLVRRDRLAGIDWDAPFATMTPDLAVEIVSPLHDPAFAEQKLADHLSAGFPLVWVIRTADRTLTVHRPDAEPTSYAVGQTVTAGPVLPDIRADVAGFFHQLANRPR